jgi:plastocyanin
MRRLISAAAPLAVALVLLVQGTALAALKDVSIQNFAFNPAATKVKLGDQIRWTNLDGTNHTTTSDGVSDGSGYTGIGLWGSGSLAQNGTFTWTFTFAGTYPYHCRFHPTLMQGTVKVPMTANPASGPVGTTFTLTWASAAPTGSLVFDVQRMDPGGTKFKKWQTGVTTLSATYMPALAGTYVFRTRVRDMNTGAVSKYSPKVSIVAT